MQFFNLIKCFICNMFTSKRNTEELSLKDIQLTSTNNVDSDIIYFNFFLPKEFKNSFEIKRVKELEEDRNVDIIEKERCIPIELLDKEVVLNGYCNPITILDFPFRGKRVNLKFCRRRWKEKGKRKSYSNNYEFHLKWIKTTKEFGFFLKEFPRRKRNEFFKFRLVPEDIMKAISTSV